MSGTRQAEETGIFDRANLTTNIQDMSAVVAVPPSLVAAALRRAVRSTLSGYGVANVKCEEAAGRSFCLKSRDLTVVIESKGHVEGSVLFQFDSPCARVLADKIAHALAGEAADTTSDDEDEFIKDTLAEFATMSITAALGSLGFPARLTPAGFSDHEGARHGDKACGGQCFTVRTDLGDFEIVIALGMFLRAGCPGEPADAAGWKRRAVIADDSRLMRKMLSRMLSQAGYDVVAEVADGMQAVEEFRRHRPDLLVLDLTMPVMGGLDALRLIRADDPSARVLICSATADTDTIVRGIQGGSVGHIAKPFDSTKLIKTIEHLFKPLECASARPSADGPPALGGSSLGVYAVGELLGEGGMAVVYEGYDRALGRKVALKIIKDDLANDIDLAIRFLGEARAVARVSHPNVVSIYFAGSDRGKHFFAMELLPGPDLGDLVDERGPLPPKEALSYLREGALGLAAAARAGLIHCDVKPSNLVFGSDGLVRVTDFGIVQFLGPKDDATTSEALGTPCFMSPEQALGKTIDHRTDVYSLGATFHFLLTGKPPYDGDDAMEIALRQAHDPVPELPNAPRKVRRLLSKMMAKSPDERHANYYELVKEVEMLM